MKCYLKCKFLGLNSGLTESKFLRVGPKILYFEYVFKVIFKFTKIKTLSS